MRKKTSKVKKNHHVALITFAVIVALILTLLWSSDCGTERLVGAYYYPWYVGGQWSSQSGQVPVFGYYDSGNTTVIDQQLTWAKGCGIDFFVISTSLYENLSNVNLVFAENARLGNLIHLCAMVEPHSDSEFAELTNYVENLTRYSSYLSWNGKPLLFVYTEYLNIPNLSSALTDLFSSRFTEEFIPLEAPYFIPNVQTYEFSNVISVSPGQFTPNYVNRNNGQYYSNQWETAIANAKVNPGRNMMVVITSWNEWYECTAIEPSTTWGGLYLQLTQQYAAQFKKT